MGIRIKPYYCPKCQSFKEWYGVTATNEFSIFHYCRSCGTECYETGALLEMMISEKATALWAGEKGEKKMNVTPDPVLTVMDFSPEEKIYRVEVLGEKVIDFGASSGWTITKVSVTRDRRALVLTLEKGEEDE